MKKILYIGNKLNHSKSNLSSIDTLGPFLEQEGYTIYYKSSRENKFYRLYDMLQACVGYRNKVDIVLIDTYSTQNFYYAFLVAQLCRLLRLKYILSLNGGNLPERLKTNPIFSRMLFSNAYKMVSPSLYLKNEFQKFGYHDIVFIPNAIEMEKYAFKEGVFKEAKLLWVRSFSRIYNSVLAIKILKALLEDGIKASLCMVGPDSDGTLKESKQLAKQLNVDVTFTGKLSKPEWITLSKDYNIFINTTNFDNMPVSVIEAMALGLVIVSTNVGGMPYLIEHNHDGILVEPNDSKVFAEAIKSIIKMPNVYKKMALNARKKVEQFDWDILKHHWFKTLQ